MRIDPKKRARNTAAVDEYMSKLDHPLKAGVQVLREAILGVDPDIYEEVKWNAPSFSYLDYIATFNLRDKSRIHLVFHNPVTPKIASELLEGNYPDGRRMAYFKDFAEVQARKSELERVVKELVNLMEQEAHSNSREE